MINWPPHPSIIRPCLSLVLFVFVLFAARAFGAEGSSAGRWQEITSDPAVEARQLEQLEHRARNRESRPANVKTATIRAHALLELASRDGEQADEEDVQQANRLIGMIDRELSAADPSGFAWSAPILATLAATNRYEPLLTEASRQSLGRLLHGFVEEYLQYEDASTAGLADSWRILLSDNHDLMKKQVAYCLAKFYVRNSGLAPSRYQGFTPAQHLEAWNRYFLAYLRARVRRGLFTETGSPNYFAVDVMPLLNLREVADDPALRRRTDSFLQVVFADVALESLRGIRGGARVRTQKGATALDVTRDSHARYTQVLAGLPTSAYWPDDRPPWGTFAECSVLSTGFRLLPQVAELFHATDERGRYEYVSARPGRGYHLRTPRGLWYTIEFPSHLRRTTYATPDFVLGSMTFDERKRYTILTQQNQVFGLTTAAEAGSRMLILTGGGQNPTRGYGYRELQAVQSRHAMLVRKQLAAIEDAPLRVYFSKDFTVDAHADGRIFARNGDDRVYVSVLATWLRGMANPLVPEPQPVQITLTDAPETGGTFLDFDRNSTFLAIEVASAGDYPSFETFQQDMSDNPAFWDNNNDEFHYHPSRGASALSLAVTNQLPRIDGAPVDLEPSPTYQSPWLFSDEEREIVTIRGIGTGEVELPFRQMTIPQ